MQNLVPGQVILCEMGENKMRVLAPPAQLGCSSLQLCYILQEDAHEGVVPR